MGKLVELIEGLKDVESMGDLRGKLKLIWGEAQRVEAEVEALKARVAELKSGAR